MEALPSQLAPDPEVAGHVVKIDFLISYHPLDGQFLELGVFLGVLLFQVFVESCSSQERAAQEGLSGSRKAFSARSRKRFPVE